MLDVRDIFPAIVEPFDSTSQAQCVVCGCWADADEIERLNWCEACELHGPKLVAIDDESPEATAWWDRLDGFLGVQLPESVAAHQQSLVWEDVQRMRLWEGETAIHPSHVGLIEAVCAYVGGNPRLVVVEP